MTQQPDQHNGHLAAIIAACPDAIISLGTDFVVKTWSAGAQRMFGFDEAEARGKILSELIVPDVYKHENTSISAAVLNGKTVLKEMLRRHKDGHLVPVEINASPILDLDGVVVGASIIYRNIGDRRRAEEARANLAAIVNSSVDAITGETLDGIVTIWNQAAERTFDYSASEMVGRSFRRLIPAAQWAEEDLIRVRLARNESVGYRETKLLTKDGRSFDASITFSPIRDNAGRLIGCSKVIRDITERKRTEAQIAEHRARLAAFVEQTPAAIGMFDTNMTYLAASRRFLSDHRAENVNIIGVPHYEAFPGIPQRWRNIHARVLAGEELSADEDPLLRPDGGTDWFRWSMKPWRTPDGQIGGALLFTELITEQIEAKHALAASEERFRVTFENAPVGVAHVGPDRRWLRVNEALCRILGYTADELTAKTILDVTHPDDIASSADRFEQVRSGKIDYYAADKRYLRKDGVTVWASLTVNCVRKRGGSMDYLVTVVEDITARKRAEAELADSEKRFRATFENAAVGIAHVSCDLRWLRANQALCRIIGWPIDELLTKSLLDISHPDDLVSELPLAQQVRDGKIDNFDMEKRFLRKDGGWAWTLLAVSCVRKSDRSIDYFVGMIQDISARRHAEEELADSEKRFRATFENAAVGITHIAPDGRFLRFNNVASRLIGWPADELITKSVPEVTHPDDVGLELVGWERLCSGKVDSDIVEKRDIRKDGTIIWVRLTRSCVRKEDGSPDYFVAVIEDVTARKRAENQVQLLMREANHRIKNLLGLVQVIARQTAAGNPEDFVRRFTERIQALAANQDLLGGSAQQGADLADLVRSQLAHFADLVGSRITAHGPKLHLNAVATQTIGLALHELATNAGKYGALSTDAGRVDMRWRVDGDTFTMSWTERNGPPVRRPERQGFGTIVISSMAKHAMDGEVQLDFAATGLVWRLTCPASSALKLSDDIHTSDDDGDDGLRRTASSGGQDYTKVH